MNHSELAVLTSKLQKMVEMLADADNEVMVAAEAVGDERILNMVAHDMLSVAGKLDRLIETVKSMNTLPADYEECGECGYDHGYEQEEAVKAHKGLTEDDLDELANLAEAFDRDPALKKQASVLDQILLTIGAPKGSLSAFKKAEEKEIERLRAKYREESLNKAYKLPADKKAEEAIKSIENSVKEYRPMEAPLSTRSCPDHPGAQMSRVGDSAFQCDLDKKIYSWQSGFTTMNGNKVPGGDVAEQTKMQNVINDTTIFDTRESKLNG